MILCAMLSAWTRSSFTNEFKKKWNKLDKHLHNIFGHKTEKPVHKKWIKKHLAHFGGLKGFNDKFKQHHDEMKNFFHAAHHLHGFGGKKHKCPHLPKLPFHLKPLYPFMPFHKPAPMPPKKQYGIHFFGKYTLNSPKMLLLANKQKVKLTEIKSMITKVDFNVDDQLLGRMRNHFAKYHRRWMGVLGGVLGGFKAMMPHLKRHCRHKGLWKMKKFPRLINRLVKLHVMIARHQALLNMLRDAQANHDKIGLLEQKLKMMKSKFEFLNQKMEFLNEMHKVHDKKTGRIC